MVHWTKGYILKKIQHTELSVCVQVNGVGKAESFLQPPLPSALCQTHVLPSYLVPSSSPTNCFHFYNDHLKQSFSIFFILLPQEVNTAIVSIRLFFQRRLSIQFGIVAEVEALYFTNILFLRNKEEINAGFELVNSLINPNFIKTTIRINQ